MGQEGVGKTTLLKSFTKWKGKGFKGVNTRANLSTDGIDIIEGIQFGDNSVTFNAWDLGGQEIYYPSHQFFLTSNSVYILVLNMVAPQFDRVDYWLQLIRGLGAAGRSKTLIYIVGTHADHPTCTEEHVNSIRCTLQQRFPALRFTGLEGFFPVRDRKSVV